MLSRFRRPEADFQVRVSKTVLQPGDDLEVRVTLVPKSDCHVRRGKLELVCTETYVQMISTQYGVQYHSKTETVSRAGETLLDEVTVRRRAPYSSTVRLLVPPTALPTIIGTPVSSVQPGISWAVIASLDVANARDIHQSHDITVLKRPTLDDPPPQPISTEFRHSQCVLTLTLSQGAARSADRLDGTLRAEALRDITASEVSVELVRIEKFGNDEKQHSVDKVSLERDVSLQSHRTREWRFRLNVGQVGVPSLNTEKSSVRWLVKGALAIRMWPDIRVEQQISVDL